MRILKHIFLAGVSAGLITLVLLTVRPEEGNGWISQGGANILAGAGYFVCLFPLCWLSIIIIAHFTGRKTKTKLDRKPPH
jgi:hypothetical protein